MESRSTISTTHTLCKLCQRSIGRNRHDWIDHRTETSLKNSTTKGCQICKLLFHTFCKHTVEDLGGCEKLRIARPSNDIVFVKGFDDAVQRFEVFGPDHEFRKIEDQADSVGAFKLISGWLDDCVSHHVACREPKDIIVPRRLIAVTDGLRLIDGNILSPKERYAALSHCWGKSRGLTTTVNTLDAFQIHIHLPSLPRTFRDAIEVTRRLGIKYLWIDALCILQDSQDDWRAEAAKMGRYYRNAHLTISALDAPDGTSGFLERPRSIPISHVDKNEYWREPGLTWKDIFRQSPLSRRGWVLQERLLSRRVLHFAQNEILWECMECSARERTTCLSTEDTGKRIIRTHYLGDTASVQFTQWYDIVCHYSGLDLSFDDDVFAAIGGIASTFRKSTGLKYAAGLWWEHLPYGFLWYCQSNRLNGKSSVSPSWSWASRRGPIKMICEPPSWVLDAACESPHNSTLQHVRMFTASIVGFRLDFGHDAMDPGRNIRLRVEACYTNVCCRSIYDTQPPFDNPDLQRSIFIYDKLGKPIGTGYLDHMPRKDSKECIAIVLLVQSDGSLTSQRDARVTYFMLIEHTQGDQGEEAFERIGIGSTADVSTDYAFDQTWLESTQQRTFLLR